MRPSLAPNLVVVVVVDVDVDVDVDDLAPSHAREH
jgi:hypothetical protein